MHPVTLTNLTMDELLALAADSPDPLTRTLAARFSQAIEAAREEGRDAGYQDGFEAAGGNLA